MTRALPAWAEAVAPVDMEGAALLLGVSRRYLVDVIAAHPHYERRGVRKVFYPEHIALLREALKCPVSESNGATASPTPLEPSTESAFDAALRLATIKPQKSNARSTKPASGNVIRMERKPSAIIYLTNPYAERAQSDMSDAWTKRRKRPKRICGYVR